MPALVIGQLRKVIAATREHLAAYADLAVKSSSNGPIGMNVMTEVVKALDAGSTP